MKRSPGLFIFCFCRGSLEKIIPARNSATGQFETKAFIHEKSKVFGFVVSNGSILINVVCAVNIKSLQNQKHNWRVSIEGMGVSSKGSDNPGGKRPAENALQNENVRQWTLA